ncbi:MAG TPA: restriction endonuclease subunit S [Longimicrobium sp.]|nr:restriction endonuclease subunit S [Longimicrobium sp.]
MKLSAYPAYRPSGVGTLGPVPAHWAVEPLRIAAPRRDERVEADAAPALPYLGLDSIEPATGRIVRTDERVVPEAVCNRFRAGDTLFGKLRPYLAKACVAPFDGLCSTELLVLARRAVEPRMLLYQLLSPRFVSLVQSSTFGAKMPRATWEFIGACAVVVPPPGEQRAVAAFLDAATARIDRLIARKRTLMARIREKRAAVVWRAVTGALSAAEAERAGMEPGPATRNSGVGWMGHLPTHWRVVPLGTVARFRGGATPTRIDPDFWDGGIPWVSPKDMKRARIVDTAEHVSEPGVRATGLSLIAPGAVLVVVRGMILAHSFPVAINQVPVTINQDMKAIVPSDAVDARFLAWVLTGSARVLVALADESAHGTRKLDAAVLATHPVPLPPLPEQRAIAGWLDRETARLDRLIATLEATITRLREYRAALIGIVVSGQADVRGAVPPASPAG